MSPAHAGTLVLSIAGLFAGSPAQAQNPAALAKVAARSASAFDTLVTPEAQRALRRLADSTAAVERATKAPPALSPAKRAPAPPERTPPPARRPAPTAGATAAATQDAAARAQSPDSAGAITAIAARGTAERVELRVVADRAVSTLSEPFRTETGSRLFLTFAHARLTLAEPPVLDPAGPLFGGIDIAERDDGVRIALELTTLDGYGLDTAGDTTILWLTRPAQVVAAPAAPLAVKPDELALARASARAGWAAFRSDVATAAAAVARVADRAGRALGGIGYDAWQGTTRALTTATVGLAAAVPVAAVARTLILIALLVTPPLLAVRLLRRRQAGGPRATEIVGHAETTTPPIREKPKRAARQPKPPPVRAAAKAAKAGKLNVTRTTADARLWAARTLADDGADAGEIARQTGLSREAAILIVRRAQKR